MPSRRFDQASTKFQTIRESGAGYQQVGEWVGPADGVPFHAGMAELSKIRIENYEFVVDELLYVVEGGVRLEEGSDVLSLAAGDGVFVEKGTRMNMDVPDRLVWTYVAYPRGDGD